MQTIEPVWLFGAIALVAGVFLGILIVRLTRPASADVDKLKSELEQARSEMARYRASVDSHFNKTSELVNELTQDYVKVYRHLAEGAQTLSDTREFSQVLEQPRGRVLITVDGDSSVTKSESEAKAEAAHAAQPAAAQPGEKKSGAGESIEQRQAESSPSADVGESPPGSAADEADSGSRPQQSESGESGSKTADASTGAAAATPSDARGQDGADREGETGSAKKVPA